MKDRLRLWFAEDSGIALAVGLASIFFPLLAILLGKMGDAIQSELMVQTSTYFFQPVTGAMGLVLGILALWLARKAKRHGTDPRQRLAEVCGVIGIVLLPIYLIFIA